MMTNKRIATIRAVTVFINLSQRSFEDEENRGHHSIGYRWPVFFLPGVMDRNKISQCS